MTRASSVYCSDCGTIRDDDGSSCGSLTCSVRVAADLRRRVEALERVAHAPVDLTALVAERAEGVARLLEADPHQFSTRPCQTCRSVSAMLGRDFGCLRRART